MNIDKIVNFCIKNNYKNNVQVMSIGIQRVVISSNNYHEYVAILSNCSKLKSVKIENNIISSANAFEGYICIYDINDYELSKNLDKNKNTLINIFFMNYRNSKNQDEAKQAQYNYAVKNNMIDAYNLIYN